MINIPSEWKKIDENNYDKIGIVNNKFIKCVSSYAVQENGVASVINFFDYSSYDEEFLD